MSEWKNVALGDFGSFTNGINKDKNAFGKGVPFVNLLDIYGKESISREPAGLVQVTENEIRNYDLKKGDILFARSSVKPEGVGQTCVVLRNFDRIVYSGFIIRYRQFDQKIWYQYAKYCFDNPIVRRSVLAKSTVSANTNINQESLKTITVPLPPLPHQRKIARILTTVDNIIEKTETAIAKYKAIKQGMMHDLFTRGIDVKTGKLRPKFEDAPELYKETELGWVPKEWEVDELETVSDEKQYSFTGGPFGSDLQTKDYEVTGVRIIQLQNIGDGEFLNSYKIFTSENKANQLYSCNIFPGDIILSKMADPVARACIIPNFHKRYLMASDGIRLKLSRNNNSIFIKEQINYYPFRRRAIALSTGTTRARIGLTELRRILIKIPQSIEQEAIGSKLETIDNIIEKEAIMKAKLIVQKSGLMQDLLTGKKEVTPDPEDYKEMEN